MVNRVKKRSQVRRDPPTPHPRGKPTHLFLSLFEEEPEALVFLDQGGQLSAALLPRLLQLRLQLSQHVELLRQSGLPRPGHLQVQLQVQGGPQEAVQTFDLQRRLTEDGEVSDRPAGGARRGNRTGTDVLTFFIRMLRLSEAFLTKGDFLESVELSLSLRFIWRHEQRVNTPGWRDTCLGGGKVRRLCAPCRCTGSEGPGRRSWSG